MHRKTKTWRLLTGTTNVVLGLTAGTAYAEESDDGFGLNEIIVTAQKREQSIQDVPAPERG